MRIEKTFIVKELQERLSQSPFLLLTDYTGLNVPQFSELRSRLGDAGAECRVVKNTFLRHAVREAGLPDLNGLGGQTAIVVGESDVCAAAKVLKSFAKENKDRPEIRMGILDGALLTREQVMELADLPPLEILQAKLLGLLQTPATQLARVLNEPGSMLARVLKAKTEGEQQEAA